MSITVALLLAATLVGPERRVAPPSYGPGYGGQYPFALASDGKDFLAVWNGFDGICASVIEEDGTPRPAPRAIAHGYPAYAAWTGDAYALVWWDSTQQTAFTARVSRNAELISEPEVLSDDEHPFPMAIAAGAEGTLIVAAVDNAIKAFLAGNDSSVVLPTTVASRSLNAVSAVAVAGGFVVVTLEKGSDPFGFPDTTVRATRISNAGAIEISRAVVSSLQSNVQSIHAAGSGEQVGFSFVVRKAEPELRMFTLDAATLTSIEHPAYAMPHDEYPQVVPTPGGFAVGLLQNRYDGEYSLDLTMIPFGGKSGRTMPLGNVLGDRLLLASNGSRVMSIWGDYRYTWADPPSPPYEVRYRNLFGLAFDATASTPESDIVPVTSTTVAQGSPVIASAGDTALVAWIDLARTARGELVATRIDARGKRLDRKPISLGTDVSRGNAPAVVFTGDVWIVAWSVRTDSGGLRTFLRRVAPDGTVLDTEPVELDASGGVTAASNGTTTLIVAGDQLFRFSRAGEQLEKQKLPLGSAGELVSNGGGFLLVWTEGSDQWPSPSPNFIDVYAMRFHASGAPIDTAPIAVAVSNANEREPVVASNGSDFLVLYQHVAADTATLRAKPVFANGSVGVERVLADGWVTVSAAGREDGYVVVFGLDDEVKIAIRALAVDAQGVPKEEPMHLGGSWSWPAWTSASGRWIAYARTDPSLGNVPRVFVRVMREGGTRRRRSL